MKIIAFDRPFDMPPCSQGWDGMLPEVRLPEGVGVELIADSARVRPGTPVFLPDFTSGWEFEVVPALYIGRVGKHIAERFSRRYIGGVGMAVRLLPPADASSECRNALALSFDGAITEIMAEGLTADAPLTIGVKLVAPDGATVKERLVTVAPEELLADATISLVSRFMTLKMGDIILPCATGLRVPALRDSVIQCRISSSGSLPDDGSPLLKVKVK